MNTEEYTRLSQQLIYASKPFQDKPWMEFPTVRQLARKLGVKQSLIAQLVEDSESLDLIVGFRAGSGVGDLDTTGDYRVEYID